MSKEKSWTSHRFGPKLAMSHFRMIRTDERMCFLLEKILFEPAVFHENATGTLVQVRRRYVEPQLPGLSKAIFEHFKEVLFKFLYMLATQAVLRIMFFSAIGKLKLCPSMTSLMDFVWVFCFVVPRYTSLVPENCVLSRLPPTIIPTMMSGVTTWWCCPRAKFLS